MPKQSQIEAILHTLSKEKLIHILVQAAAEDHVLENMILLKYTKEAKGAYDQQLKSYKKLIDSIVKRYKGRDGFIPYRDTGRFASEMFMLLEELDDSVDPLLALETAWLVLEEGVEAFQYADDSNGDIGMLVQDAVERIGAIALRLEGQGSSVREPFFERLLHMSESQVFQGWEDFQIALFRICTEFADIDKLRERLRKAIEHQIASNLNDEYNQYSNNVLREILFQLIRDYGTKGEAEKFLNEHLHIKYFREQAIDQNMKSRNYRRVLELAEEGEKQDQQFPGLVIMWKTARYEAYKQLSLKKEQELLGRELLLSGEYQFYQELEDLIEGDREELYRSILAELKQARHWGARQVYLELISDKNDLEEMMLYVKANPHLIEEYAARLSADYLEEVTQIYSQYIYSAAQAASNRNQYRRVCGMLKKYKKVAGKPSQEQIIQQLKTQYIRRPAFLDELDNV